MSRKVLILTLVTLSMGLIQYSYGATYPARPIEIYVGFTPGSPYDLAARLLADPASKYLGQPVVVINKPGALGSLSNAEVIASKPDGYRLALTDTGFFSLTTKTKKVPYDPRDLVPVVNFYQNKPLLVVKGDSPWKTLNDLLDYGRKNPGKLTFCHMGAGGHTHLCGLLLFKAAGVQAVDIPYPGSSEMVSALLGGHVDILIGGWGTAKDHLKVGKMRALVAISDRRWEDPSDLPCLGELGFPNLKITPIFAGIYIRKGTPEEIVKILFDTFEKIIKNPEFSKSIDKFGGGFRFEGPEFMNEQIEKSEEAFVPLLKELGLYVK